MRTRIPNNRLKLSFERVPIFVGVFLLLIGLNKFSCLNHKSVVISIDGKLRIRIVNILAWVHVRR